MQFVKQNRFFTYGLPFMVCYLTLDILRSRQLEILWQASSCFLTRSREHVCLSFVLMCSCAPYIQCGRSVLKLDRVWPGLRLFTSDVHPWMARVRYRNNNKTYLNHI